MNYGICFLSVTPVRKENRDSSEIISQLLFGETFQIISQQDNWVRVRACYDNYEGWIDGKQLLKVDKNFINKMNDGNTGCTLEIAQSVISKDQQVPVVLGSTLPFYDGINFRLNHEKYIFNGQAVIPQQIIDRETLIEKIALKYLNAPYLWGGRSPFGIDCSGFTQMVFKIAGFKLPRDSYQQAESGKPLNFIHESQTGDLAFFANKEGKIAHVGIILDKQKIIHAHGQVRIDKIDHHGIYNEKISQYSHKLRFLRRVL